LFVENTRWAEAGVTFATLHVVGSNNSLVPWYTDDKTGTKIDDPMRRLTEELAREAADLDWLERTGLAEAVRMRARRGRPVLGICGGLQMLGERIEDEAGVDGSANGLALLPLRTVFAASKQTEKTSTQFSPLAEPWAALGGKRLTGYQIRHGQTTTTAPVTEALPDGLGYVEGPVLGIYLHGLFERPDMLEALFGTSPHRSLDEAFDELADAVEERLDVAALLDQVRAA